MSVCPTILYFWHIRVSVLEMFVACKSSQTVFLFFRHPSPSVLIPALRTVGNIVTGDDLQTQVLNALR